MFKIYKFNFVCYNPTIRAPHVGFGGLMQPIMKMITP